MIVIVDCFALQVLQAKAKKGKGILLQYAIGGLIERKLDTVRLQFFSFRCSAALQNATGTSGKKEASPAAK